MIEIPKMTKVESSNVKAVGYNGKQLFVEYQTGLYIYEKVPKKLYEELMAAPSKGKYLSENVKNKYSYNRIAFSSSKAD